MNVDSLKAKVFTKIMDDCDNPALFSEELIMQASLIFDEFSYDEEQARVIKEVYLQVIKRAHFFNKLQLS